MQQTRHNRRVLHSLVNYPWKILVLHTHFIKIWYVIGDILFYFMGPQHSYKLLLWQIRDEGSIGIFSCHCSTRNFPHTTIMVYLINMRSMLMVILYYKRPNWIYLLFYFHFPKAITNSAVWITYHYHIPMLLKRFYRSKSNSP